jgi:LmbE family N-acetylglucosaminyl deacetylase
MIPLIDENEWLEFFKNLSLYTPLYYKTVVLAPHPDDETLGVGGLIADLRLKKIDVKIIAVTDGEQAYSDIKNLRNVRKREQIQALGKLGVSADHIIRVRLKDSSVSLFEDQLEQFVLPLIDHQTHLIAPWVGDFHPDHEAVGRVATKISQSTGAFLSYYFFWTWHHASISTVKNLPLTLYPLESNTFNLKQNALNCYVSQLTHPKGEPILASNLLAPAKRRFEVYCPYPGSFC